MGWAIANWIFLEGRYVRDNLIGNGPLLGLSPTLFLSYIESIVREFASDHVDKLYLPIEEVKSNRADEVRAAMEAFA
jgi:hypothetical protein